MRRCLLLLFSIFCCHWAFLQENYPHADSLVQLFYKHSEPEIKWDILSQITKFYNSNNPDSAILYAKKTLDYARAELPTKVSRSYVLLGEYHTEYKEYEKASSYLYEAIRLSEADHCLECKILALNELFQIPYDRAEYDQALEILRQGLAVATQLKDSTSLARSYINISLVFSQIPVQDSSIFYARRGIEIAKAIDNPIFLRFGYNNLGVTYENVGNYEAAIQAFKLAARYSAVGNDKEMQATCLFNVGSSFGLWGQADSAIYYLNQSKVLMEELKRKDLLAYYYEGMADILKGQEKYREALEYFQIGVALNDSLQAEIYGKNLTEAETKFQTQQKEAELVKKELELEYQNSLRNRIIGIAIVLLLGVIALFQYFRNKDKLKKKEAELALQLEHAEAEKLRELDQLKSQFFANISHEFRTPLTLIQGPLQSAERELDKTGSGDVPVSGKYIRTMHNSARRLLNLVNQLLDLAKLESGKMKLAATKLDLAQFVKVLAGSFESMAESNQIEYRINIPDSPLVAWFDRDQMEKALVNLISNAFKFTPNGGIIQVTLERMGQTVRIGVKDSGIGIGEEELPHIFKRFHSNSNTKYGGTGIGLALCKELVELHGGSIEVKSEKDMGSHFIINLPLGRDHLPDEYLQPTTAVNEYLPPVHISSPATTEEEFREALADKDNAPSILIVEDNPEVRLYIADQLRNDYQLLQAPNGKEGLKIALEKIPDLIISDVMMPEMNGVELCQKIKEDERSSHIPLILLTAKAEQADKIEGLESGADSYLAKPFDATELKVRIKNLITQRRLLQERYQGNILQLKPTEVSVNSKDEIFLRKLMETIEENMENEDFGVEDLSRAVAMSRYQLHRKLKALTNQSISIFIRRMRLERAHQLLEQGAGNSTEICYRVGFSSPAYFSKCFKEQFGIVPSEVGIVDKPG